ncbi:hypothetical protein OWV82_025256 [Melia azedarach]|uniref:Uncharacterized protein n=1 Tax=Melia azedarach TaxID=155640 RepID=A0ACC1WTC9_MELAZ|nr:hypothetical protein OWV82_025256 [Melia azedarach]
MEIFKNQKPFLILFLLVLHCSSLHPGEAQSPTETTEETTTQLQVPPGLRQDGKNLPLPASPPFPFPIPATNKNSPFGPSLNNPGKQPQTVFPAQQLNYPQQSLNQPLSGIAQPFTSTNQPFLGVNQQPFSSFNQPFGNQQGLADNINTFENGVSDKNRLPRAITLVSSLFALIANLGFIS